MLAVPLFAVSHPRVNSSCQNWQAEMSKTLHPVLFFIIDTDSELKFNQQQ